jgi:class 3 adenylate cyclase
VATTAEFNSKMEELKDHAIAAVSALEAESVAPLNPEVRHTHVGSRFGAIVSKLRVLLYTYTWWI